MISRPIQFTLGLTIALFMLVTPFLYQSYHGRMFRNFRVVKDGVVYRSAQLPTGGLARLVNDYRIKTVVCLRDGDKANDQAEESYCHANGIQFVRLMPLEWTRASDGSAPVEANLAKFREIVKNPANHPILLHCFAGTHRTGSYVAVYRMDFEGWSNERAMNELRALGYVTLDSDENVANFLKTYRPVRTTISDHPLRGS